MRRQMIALAAAACLATAACSPAEPNVTPTDAATSAVDSPSPSTDPTSVESETTEASPTVSESGTPAASPTASESATPGASPTASPSSSGKTTADDVDLAIQTFAISAQDAMLAAVEKAGGGFVYSIELDWSQYHNAWVYELDVLMGTMDHDVDINADTGEVLELERDETNDKKQAVSLDSPMTWESARDKALAAVQGQVTGWKLEYDDDYTAYEFGIVDSSGDEIEVKVNVATDTVRIDD